jgi:hypothetical protein
VFQWHAWFKTGHTSVDDDELTERPTSCKTPETVAQIQEFVHQDQRQSIHDIAERGNGYGTCQRVLVKKLGMHHTAAKFVPRILTADQKQQRVNIRTEIHQLTSDDETFLFRVITGDLAPCELFLFLKMKLKLKGRPFDTTEDIEAESQRVLDTLTEKDFQEVFHNGRQWDQCLHAGGNRYYLRGFY